MMDLRAKDSSVDFFVTDSTDPILLYIRSKKLYQTKLRNTKTRDREKTLTTKAKTKTRLVSKVTQKGSKVEVRTDEVVTPAQSVLRFPG